MADWFFIPLNKRLAASNDFKCFVSAALFSLIAVKSEFLVIGF
jgi:hypothetical protein